VYGLTRGTITLIGVGAAGVLLWLTSQFDGDASGDYWTTMALVAGAGLVMALSQLLGGWTKWGWPRLSPTVFVLGFLPALVAGGIVLLAAQPDSSAFGAGFASDLGLDGLAEDFTSVLPAVAFLIGLTFGFAFDTTGPVVDDDEVVERGERAPYPVDRRATDEPVTAERRALRRDRETADDAWDDGEVTERERTREHEPEPVLAGDGHDGRDVRATEDRDGDVRPVEEEQPRRRGFFRR
jgi:hypothetical protein